MITTTDVKGYFNHHLRICLERGREKERNINLLFSMCSLTGDQTTTQVCALTRNQTSNQEHKRYRDGGPYCISI